MRSKSGGVLGCLTLAFLGLLTSSCFTKQVRLTASSEKLVEYLANAKVESTAPRSVGSLWDERSSGLMMDFKARRAGDIVTVLVQESTNAVTTATADTSHSAQQST